MLKIALAGNPNCGKSTLFNLLTGLRQKTGNFPGVTVEKHSAVIHDTGKNSNEKNRIELLDLPGTYSLFAKSPDETITCDVLCNENNVDHPNAVLLILDATAIRRGLYLATQIMDLGLPVWIVLNRIDLAKNKGIGIQLEELKAKFQVDIFEVNSISGDGVEELKNALFKGLPKKNIFLSKEEIEGVFSDGNSPKYSNFKTVVLDFLAGVLDEKQASKLQSQEAVLRYKKIADKLQNVFSNEPPLAKSHSSKLDALLTHRIGGYLFFLALLFLIFQAVFSLATIPMELIEEVFSSSGEFIYHQLPDGILRELLVKGIWAGLGGVVIFIPQIALLFGFIAILEDSGYMARVSLLMDKLLRGFGLNGKSVIPLMSAVACAVPSILGTRTIANNKERLITILILPLVSCSARLPVYTLLIGLVIPDAQFLGIFNYQGLALFLLYLIGFFAALATAFALKFLLKTRERSYFMMEMPVYQFPRWQNVFYTMYGKVKVFLFEAGKIIMAISVVLWFLSSFAPGEKHDALNQKYQALALQFPDSSESINFRLSEEKLSTSYAGILGKSIEPFIQPLGYDWKIGISLITSFAAREVFVGTMATLYSSDESETNLRARLKAAKHPQTGLPIYTLASGFSLLVFYAFALQCMSTIAVVKRETGSWKFTLLQLFYLTALAYLAAFIAFKLLS